MFGASHFFNGLISRKAPPVVVALCSQAGGALLMVAWVTVAPPAVPSAQDLVWAGASGIGAGCGVAAMYEGMRRSRISVVVPVTSVISVAAPLLASVVFLGDSVTVPVALAATALLPAAWLLSRPTRLSRTPEHLDGPCSGNTAAAGFGLMAGSGYALQLFALSQITQATPAAPMLIAQLVSLAPLTGFALVRFPTEVTDVRSGMGRSAGRLSLGAAAVGALAGAAMIAFLYAARAGELPVVMVAIALYPALPVLLAVVVLGERLGRTQVTGLGILAFALPLISLA